MRYRVLAHLNKPNPMIKQRMHFYPDKGYTRITRLLGCELPILCAGMGGVARYELTAAVSNAGGFGTLGMVRESEHFIRDQVQATRACTTRPFGVNIIPAATNPELLKKQVDTIIELKLPVVTLFWDLIPWVVHSFREAGVTILYQIGSVAEANAVLAEGVDGIIAQGVEAGGHVRGLISTVNLIRSLRGLTDKPVIAAGGISSGKDMIRLLDNGAHGICCGTAFLATHEAFAHRFHKQQILASTAGDTVHTTLFHINWPPGAPVRVIKNSVTDPTDVNESTEKSVIAYDSDQPVYLYSTDSPLRTTEGDLEKMALYAGASCTGITDICSAGERIDQLLNQAGQAINRGPPP